MTVLKGDHRIYSPSKADETQRQLKEVFDNLTGFGFGLTVQDVDALAEQEAESRLLPQQKPNFHE